MFKWTLHWLFPCLLTAQSSVSATIVDAETGEAIPYTRISLRKRQAGTLSDTSGRFDLPISAADLQDSLEIASIGYQSQRWHVNRLPEVMRLVPQDVQLGEVLITNKTLIPKWVGRDGTAGSVTISSTPEDVEKAASGRGGELAVTLRQGGGGYLRTLRFYVLACKFDTVLLRFRIYSVQDGRPAQELTPKNLYLTITKQSQGWQTVPVGQLVEVPTRFAVAIEFVRAVYPPQMSVRLGTTLPAGIVLDNQVFLRNPGEDNWRASPIPINASVQAELLVED